MQLGKLIGFASAAIFSAHGFARADGLPPDAGLVTRLVGKATYRNPTRKAPVSLAEWVKLHVGDEIVAGDKTELRVEYFASRRAETWRGPATFKIGERESQLVKGTGPAVEMKDPALIQGRQQVPTLLREAGVGRPGSGVTRSGGDDKPVLSEDEKAQLAAAKSAYKTERKKSAADDLSPELTYLAVLRDFQMWDEMKTFTADARKRFPASSELRTIASWLAQRSKH
jgi:hypothetical protein